MEASLKVGGARVARQSGGGGDGDSCAILFLGDDSQIVLASNPIRLVHVAILSDYYGC